MHAVGPTKLLLDRLDVCVRLNTAVVNNDICINLIYETIRSHT